MLVIDRIEFDVSNHLEHMRKLESDHTPVGEKHLEASDKVIDVRYVSKHVIRNDQVGRTIAIPQPACGFGAKEGNFSRNTARFPSHLRTVCGRIDAKTGNAGLDEMLEQIA